MNYFLCIYYVEIYFNIYNINRSFDNNTQYKYFYNLNVLSQFMRKFIPVFKVKSKKSFVI